MPVLTPVAAAALVVESIALAIVYARYSTDITASNPLVWVLVMAALPACVAYGRFALQPVL